MKRINTVYLWSQCSTAKLCLTVSPWTTAHQASLSFTISRSLLKFMSTESIMPSRQLILCAPQPSPPALNLSQHQGLFQWVPFTSGGQSIGRFSISPSNEYSVLISFRIDWLYLLAAQGTLKSLFSTTVLEHQFFGTQPSLCSKSLKCTWLLKHSLIFSVSLC